MDLTRRMTRIIGTLGPSSDDARTVARLIKAGLDVARLNMSHGDHDSHRKLAKLVRREAKKAGRAVGLMVDLQGPKVRLGLFPTALKISKGKVITLTTRTSETDLSKAIIPVDYGALPLETEAGHEILLADGAVRVRVERVRGHRVRCRVLEGNELLPRAGFSLPQATAVRSPITAKDKRDIAFAVELGADFIALSFVRRGSDLVGARRLIRRHGGHQKLIAKIETATAVQNLDEIIAGADSIMVARGDLGVELPPERVPVEQKRIIRATGVAGKPVITATQMLESMRSASRPTRAEASDVANAVLDGSWAVMLSAETASGDYPIQSVEMMNRIIRESEQYFFMVPKRRRPQLAVSVTEGIAEAGTYIAFEVGACAIIALTRSGTTARQAARFRPNLPVYAYTPSPKVVTQMTLYRGVTPRFLKAQKTFSRAIELAVKDLLVRKELSRGDLVVVLGGNPDEPGGTNRLVVHEAR